MSNGGLNKDRIIELLGELGRRLDARGISANVYIVGGSAMALAYDRDRLTRDIDGVYVPKMEVYAEAERMVSDYDDLDSGWLNDAAKGFLTSNRDTEARIIASFPGVTVSVASPERLLAMKIHAARIDRDQDDILKLCEIIGIRSIDQALEIASAEYGSQLLPKSKFLTIELLQDHLPMSIEDFAMSDQLPMIPMVSVADSHGELQICGHIVKSTGLPCLLPPGGHRQHRSR